MTWLAWRNGLAAGAFCYLGAHFGAGWSHTEAALTAAFWTASVYYITHTSQE